MPMLFQLVNWMGVIHRHKIPVQKTTFIPMKSYGFMILSNLTWRKPRENIKSQKMVRDMSFPPSTACRARHVSRPLEYPWEHSEPMTSQLGNCLSPLKEPFPCPTR